MIEFTLPSLGADMDEGTLLEWRVAPGDTVRRGQVIAVVDTVKAAIDVECWHEGIIDTLVVAPGARIPVGTVLALLRAPDETAEQAAAWKAARAQAAPPAAPAALPTRGIGPAPAAEQPRAAAAPPEARRRISPAARLRAQELRVDIARIEGTGADGAIGIVDVERAAAAAAAAPPGRSELMRQTIAAAMTRSKREIPHYYLTQTVLLERAARWLKERNAARPIGERLLLAALIVRALAKALPRFPEFNGFFRDGRFQPAVEIHIGLAIALRGGGLVAPALLDVRAKPIDQLMAELTDLVRRARSYTLKSSELSSATITLTSLGDGAADSVLGVIYPPQVALVGVGSPSERACVADGALTAALAATLSLSADHRVSDGHRGALFLAAVAALLQQPESL